MFVGMPGTGLGGLFYALLILLMPVRKLWLRRHGGSWRLIARLWLLLAGIVAALALKALGLNALLGLLDLPTIAQASPTMAAAQGYVLPALALSPLVTLAAVVLAVHLLRWVKASPGRRAPMRPHPAAN